MSIDTKTPERLEDVLARLEGVNRSGAGYMARCPAHDDRRASLSVAEGEDGRVLLFCQAGCQTADVAAALGLSLSDLMGDARDPDGGETNLVATYDYVDECGALLYQDVRYAPKTFRQRRPDGHGWQWRLEGVRRVLYRMPQVIAAARSHDTIYVCEGEKDVEALERAGCTATCNAGGAGKWRPEYSEALRGANVIIVADKDEPGRAHAVNVATSLASVASSVIIVEAAEGKDAADHLAKGRGLDEFVPLDVPDKVRADAAPAGEMPPSEDLADTGNANRFVRLYGDCVRYCAVEKLWYRYDGIHWRPDERLFVEDAMGQVALSIYEEAARVGDAERAKKIAGWAKHSLSASARKAALDCARSDPRIVVCPADFDRDGWLLNCSNGTLDLRLDGVGLRAHDPADLIRKLAPVVYDEKARSDLLERVLAEATGDDAEYLRHLRRFLGSALTADSEAELAAIAIGPTETGKSTVLGAVRRTLGDYAADVKPDTFYLREGAGATRDDLLRLDGVRLALVGEADRHRRMDEGLLKAFVSGENITVRGVYRRDVELRPVAKVVYHTNELPRMTDDDDAVWRRALIWPFEHRPARPDSNVKKTLFDTAVSGPAILRWLVEGCRAWQLDGAGSRAWDDRPWSSRPSSARARR